MQVRGCDLLIADAAFVIRDGLRPGDRSRSRVPIIVLGSEADAARTDAITASATYLARPVEQAMLACFVSMALIESRPTRRSVRKAVDRFSAYANGLPVRLLDVSNEGVRLETPTGQRTPLPPLFNVRVPFVGVAVTMQRRWTRPSSAGVSCAWYGGALSQNRPAAEQGWRAFVDTVPTVTAGAAQNR